MRGSACDSEVYVHMKVLSDPPADDADGGERQWGRGRCEGGGSMGIGVGMVGMDEVGVVSY